MSKGIAKQSYSGDCDVSNQSFTQLHFLGSPAEMLASSRRSSIDVPVSERVRKSLGLNSKLQQHREIGVTDADTQLANCRCLRRISFRRGGTARDSGGEVFVAETEYLCIVRATRFQGIGSRCER